ncbi:phosphoribosyltransferase [Novosphingobium sp. PS1R-30]|uniref:Phosphoribosyltransferase n=1 Tax=Novosphingobium anseongense TaxID=3133436 RepID=A0ABU8S2K2_9SPHN
MGIEVSADNVVTINDQHEKGVDTSVAGNPNKSRFKGIPLFHVFKRNQRGARRDDGNPLIHALKDRRGFSILPFWRNLIMSRAKAILEKSKAELEGFDFVMPMPSSSPFCAQFAEMVSQVAGAPLLASDFLRKRTVGEVLAEVKAHPPKVRPGKTSSLASQVHAWEKMSPESQYQAKEVDLSLRPLFSGFAMDGDIPDVQGKRVLVVDDLFATGSSLLSVREILGGQMGAEVCGLCFLSGT